jgi:hypothetical protein
MNVADIHFHDSVIQRVIEFPERDELAFEVDYPTNWENNVFEIRYIVFRDVLNYSVCEGGFVGKPTLLDVYENGEVESRQKVTLQTNAGTRTLLYRSVALVDQYDAA